MEAIARHQPIVRLAAAQRLLAEAFRHAEAEGWHVAAAVLDPSGHLVAAARMDGVSATILDIAIDKAFTAALGNSSRAFFERMSSSHALELGLVNRPRLCAWEGGVPLRADGVLIGALGVSGAAGPDDVACANAALGALGLAVEPITPPRGA